MMGLIVNLNNQSVGEDRILIGEDLKSGSTVALRMRTMIMGHIVNLNN